MKREMLLKLLERYTPLIEEIVHKNKIINFIKNNTDCFERTLQEGHVTASAMLLNKNHTQALLMHHAKLDMWVQLGGHCDGESDVLQVAIKEAQEESGIMALEAVSSEIFDIDIHLIPANKKEAAHYHYDVRFLLHVVSDESIVQNSESKALQWFDVTGATLPTKERSVVRLFEKLVA
ncbi:MAG: NUDIX hydrolase [Candidatus Dependentiae bacterium]|nr:NUDIX hydrolase [Candidatus Dependentiae bacterium]